MNLLFSLEDVGAIARVGQKSQTSNRITTSCNENGGGPSKHFNFSALFVIMLTHNLVKLRYVWFDKNKLKIHPNGMANIKKKHL